MLFLSVLEPSSGRITREIIKKIFLKTGDLDRGVLIYSAEKIGWAKDIKPDILVLYQKK